MKELFDSVTRIEKEELVRANKENPLFSSDHEGIAVIDEELWEADEVRRKVSRLFSEVKSMTFVNRPEEARRYARDLKMTALLTACEYIQVAAMAEKFNMDEESFTQEHCDSLSKCCGCGNCDCEECEGSEPELPTITISLRDLIEFKLAEEKREDKDAE